MRNTKRKKKKGVINTCRKKQWCLDAHSRTNKPTKQDINKPTNQDINKLLI